MTINFHDDTNKQSYTTRKADDSWLELMEMIIDFKAAKRALDIGCGGGIYTKALADLGIPAVTGVDFSKTMIDGAKVNCRDYKQINFQVATAFETGLPSEQYDVILERALIHHLSDLKSCFKEAFRLLKPGGIFVIQDRTPFDCLLEGTSNHIRGYILSMFPQLVDLEIKRRHESNTILQKLKAANFVDLEEVKLWKTRKTYSSKKELLDDIRSRTGRSILHELNDQELEELIAFLDGKLVEKEIVEKDRWTFWKAIKK
ncbi:class I SAM-dependent methyltransferase [Virgibacillus necropolis]|uniref:SAM-dependent methyltransferase n=1 Tax=Virgibacillus necropolis TaxID=163877 RepID=A0A221MGI8_9BACI|nr:class I SAM-dependent methyltransferase [Virgibacillus necropolis]ASN06755.1 SAM-dependent methyltransferase [Virgibacillus necropolis]